MNQQMRILLAVTLSMIIIFTWQRFFLLPEQVSINESIHENNAEQKDDIIEVDSKPTIETEYINNTRFRFENDFITGSINLIGAQIDDLILKKYQNNDGKDMILLSPNFTVEPNFLKIDWQSKDDIELPTSKSVWCACDATQNKIVMHWSNKQNVLFKIEIVHDNMYMLKINTVVDFSQSILENIQINARVLLQRSRNALISDSMILHEGPIGVVNNKLIEINFAKVGKENYKFVSNQIVDWIGFSDKYWLVALIPAKNTPITGGISSYFFKAWQKDKYRIELALPTHNSNQQVISESFMLFAGAKSIEVLDKYEKMFDIHMFDHAVDFGILYFITKPIFLLLNYFYKVIGNFGFAIMLLTILTKLLLFPLAYKSVKSMNKIKKIQPKINKLKEQYENNALLFQQSLIALYKKEKVNPASGCLPIILQMPIFFALYKVLYVTIEMRHAPFVWWIQDLSASDPTTLFNLFGLINWQPPTFLMIGVLPILMSLSMYIQQSLNPQDATQSAVMKIMVFVLLFMFAQFPSGLLLYWTWSNIISIIQQIVIKYMPE